MGQPGTNIQKWGEWDEEAAAQDKSAFEFEGSKFWKPKDGATSQIRILPAKRGSGQKSPFVKTFSHFVELIEGEKASIVSFNCPRRMAKQPCPLCAKADKLRARGNKADHERAKKFFSKPRVYAAVVDRNNEDAGVQTFAFGIQIFDQLNDKRDEFGDFTHPIRGRDVLIKAGKNKGGFNEYKVRVAKEEGPIHEDASTMDEWADQLPDLSVHARILSLEEIKALMDKAVEAGSGGGGDEEEKPARRASGGNGTSSRRSRQDDDDDDDSGERSIDTDGETVGEDDDWDA